MGTNRVVTIALFASAIILTPGAFAEEGDLEVSADELIAKVIEQTRSLSSYSELTMAIKRPGWERSSQFRVWTRGLDDALIRFTAPPKDAGNATLKVGDKMWTYSPQIRRAVRLPRSMMSQEWAGSDFSYDDLARSDSLMRYYSHAVTKIERQEGFKVYTIDSIPRENAPIVWGKETTVIREDGIVLAQVFYDQELKEVKSMRTLVVGEMGGRMIPLRMRMSKVELPDSWTEVSYVSAEFDLELDERMFTQYALRGES